MFDGRIDHLNWAYISHQLFCDDFFFQIWQFLEWSYVLSVLAHSTDTTPTPYRAPQECFLGSAVAPSDLLFSTHLALRCGGDALSTLELGAWIQCRIKEGAENAAASGPFVK